MANARKSSPTVSHRVVTATLAGTIVLAGGAFTLSFASLSNLAELAGISATLAWIWPLIVDGLIVVSTMAILALAGHGRRVLYYPWALLAGGSLVSVAANALHAILSAAGTVPAVVSALVAAVPPVVLLAVTHLSVVLVQQAGERAVKPVSAVKRGRRAAEPEVATPPLALEQHAAVALVGAGDEPAAQAA